MVVQDSVLEIVATCKFAALVRANTTAILVAMLSEERAYDVNRRVLARGEENPDVPARLVDNEEVGRVAIVREYHAIRRLAAFSKVGCRSAHEAKVHVESAPTGRSTNGRPLCSLFPNLGACLKVDKPKWVVVEFRGYPDRVARKPIQLGDTRRAKTEEP
jgi:hypothetical protein